MISIKKYQLKKDAEGRYHVKSCEIIPCPVCGGLLIVIGIRERGIIDSRGEKRILIIRRLRCKGCYAIHHELPEVIVPYKRHCAMTIEKIVTGKSEDVPCETRTIHHIRAWWASHKLYFKSILASLQEKYAVDFPEEPAPKEIVRAVVNANLWPHTRTVYLTG